MKMKFLSNVLKLVVALAGSSWSATAQQDSFSDCHSNPDPHFSTWDGTYYDYHGGCYLVLVHVPGFLDIHMHTSPVVGYSFIDQVGLRVGLDAVDLTVSTGAVIPTSLGGHPFTYDGSSVYELSLNNGQYVRVFNWGNSMAVHVHGLPSDFSSAVGMCGTWGAPGLVARNGALLADGDAMGDDWKVGASAPNDSPFIGSSIVCEPAVLHGEGCADTGCLCQGDTADGRRCACFGKAFEDRLQQDDGCLCANDGCVTEDEVKAACEHIADGDQQGNCAFDVKITGDATFGEAPFYEEPKPPLSDSWCDRRGSKCAAKGGTCVFDCVASKEFACLRKHCRENDDAPGIDEERDRCACKVPKQPKKSKSRKSSKKRKRDENRN